MMKKIALLLATLLCALACIFALVDCNDTADNTDNSDTGTSTDTATDTGSSTATETVTDIGSADTETDTSTDTDIPADTETNTKDPVDIEDEFVTYRIISEKEAALVEYKGNEKYFTIPSTVTIDSKEYIVTTIANYAFNGCKNINGVTIPYSITSIGDYAFYGCSNLISITIPGSIISIGNSAFKNCYRLTEVCNMSSLSIGLGSANNGYIGYYATTVYTPASKPECKITITDEGYMFFECNDFTYLIGYNGDKTSLVLPYKFNDKEYAIKKYAFSGCSSLTSITIPNSVTNIGDSAFSGCSSLTSITIPNSITSIGSGAFAGCSSLESITLPFVGGSASVALSSSLTLFGYIFGTNSYTGGVATEQYYNDSTYYIPSTLKSVTITGGHILDYAFRNCSSLTSISIGNGVTSVGNQAFYYCSNLTSITIPDSVTSIGYEAFSGCSRLKGITVSSGNTKYHSDGNCLIETESKTLISGCKNSKIPTDGSVTRIGRYAFSGCSSLTSITIPDSVSSIGNSAFSDCSSLTSITIPNSVTSIVSYAFDGCSSLTSITIPDSVTSIGNYAFSGCSSLTSITIPDSVASIGDEAFRNCSSLTSITIPDSVASIGSNAFSGCYNIETATITVFAISYIPNSKLKTVIITSGESIYDYAFRYCSSLTSITIPNSVTSIARYAFSGCSSLTSITVSSGNTKYHSSGNCLIKTKSKTLILGCKNSIIPTDGSVTSIGGGAFSYCSSLASVTIPNSVTSIGGEAFSYCSSLTSVTIPNSVTSIGGEAFSYCSSLTSVTIPNSVTSIGSNAFSGCSSLESITLPFVGGSVKTSSDTYQYPFGYIFGESSYEGGIATEQYYYDSSTNSTTYSTYYIPSTLKSVTITGGNILYGAFYGCSGLTSITIPDSVTYIGRDAFFGCSRLTSITIPNSVTSIGSYAFYGCSRLTSITIPNSVTSIGNYAFSGCSSLNEVFYKGTEAEWNAISIGSGNSYLTDATRYYYSETEPAGEGKYWHYDADGKTILKWE